jgi:hypothetical protein
MEEARAWRVTAVRADGTQRPDHCDIWMSARFQARGAANVIGRRLGASCVAAAGSARCGPGRDPRFAGYRADPLRTGECGQDGYWLRPPDDESTDPLHWTLHWSIGNSNACRCGTDCWSAVNPDRYAAPADQHPNVHDRWEFGVPITRGAKRAIDDGTVPAVAPNIVRVEDSGRISWRHRRSDPVMRLRDEIARRFGREWGSVPPPEGPITLLALRGDRAVAFALLETKDYWRWTDDPPTEGPDGVIARRWTQDTPCWALAVIWTAHAWRGEGIGLELVAATRTIEPALPFAFVLPFSPSGLALARSVCKSDHFPVTR